MPVHPSAPVLIRVRLEAKGFSLVLASFDYEAPAHYEMAVDVGEGGVVLISGRLLADIVKALPNKPIDPEIEGDKVAVSRGSVRFSLVVMAADDCLVLPVMPTVADTIGAHDPAHAIGQIFTAASRSDTLSLLTSAQIEVEGGSLALMTTDRHRLAMWELI